LKASLKACNTKQILIDGFNLIYKFPDLEELISRGDLRGAMRGLLDILKDYRKTANKKIRVVFDGKKESGNQTESEKVGGIDVYYSIDHTADFIIMNMIKHDPRANLITVVSSDKEIVSYVNRFKSPVILSENFADLVIQTLEPKEPPDPPEKDQNISLSGDELTFWEKIFSKK
jgi:predicted RNA-binding protein with PIN domain